MTQSSIPDGRAVYADLHTKLEAGKSPAAQALAEQLVQMYLEHCQDGTTMQAVLGGLYRSFSGLAQTYRKDDEVYQQAKRILNDRNWILTKAATPGIYVLEPRGASV